MKSWKIYGFWIGLCEAVGALAGFLSRDGIAAYQAGCKPAISPPGWVFIVVWIVLYALMGIGAAGITLVPTGYHRGRGLNLMVIQLAVNFCWPLLFFNLRTYAFSLLWLLMLLALVAAMTVEFSKVDKTAALLQIPYILWLCFAAVLNDLVMRLR